MKPTDLIDDKNDKHLLLPQHEQWMLDGQKVTEAAASRVNEVMNNDFFTADRSSGGGRIRPSMCGKCIRAQWFSYQGVPTGFSGNKYTITGTWAHYRWQLSGLSAGWLKDIEVNVSTDWGLSGAADGITSEGNIWELKTTNYHTFNKVSKGEPIPKEHAYQVNAYMEAVGAERAHLFYEERGYLKTYEVIVSYSQKLADRMRDEGAIIKAPEPLGMLDDCRKQRGKQYEYCDYKSICEATV